MTSEQLFLQLIAKAMLDFGVDFSFSVTPNHDPAVWEALAQHQQSPRRTPWTPSPPLCGQTPGTSPASTRSSAFWNRWATPPSPVTISAENATGRCLRRFCVLRGTVCQTSAAMSHTSPMPPAPISV